MSHHVCEAELEIEKLLTFLYSNGGRGGGACMERTQLFRSKVKRSYYVIGAALQVFKPDQNNEGLDFHWG